MSDNFMEPYNGDLGPNWVTIANWEGGLVVESNEELTLGVIRKRRYVFARSRRAAIARVVRRIVLEENQ